MMIFNLLLMKLQLIEIKKYGYPQVNRHQIIHWIMGIGIVFYDGTPPAYFILAMCIEKAIFLKIVDDTPPEEVIVLIVIESDDAPKPIPLKDRPNYKDYFR